MFERMNRSNDSALAFRISRPLSREEVKTITDELAGTITARGKIRVLLDLQAFPYEDLGALWEDLKFDVKHAKDFERLALAGGGELENWATRIFGALTFTRCRCFGKDQVEDAWQWLTEE